MWSTFRLQPFISVAFFFLTFVTMSCDKAKDRPLKVDTKTSADLIQISNIHDVTSDKNAAFFYRENKNNDVSSVDKTQQVKADTDIEKILSKIKNETHKNEITEHLKNNLVAFMVTEENSVKKIKIFKVVTTDTENTETMKSTTAALKQNGLAEKNNEIIIDKNKIESTQTSNLNDNSYTLDELKQMKNLDHSTSETMQTQSNEQDDIEFVEITSIEIKKAGVLDQQKTDYNERTSILEVVERSLDLSTHLVLGDEISTEPASL